MGYHDNQSVGSDFFQNIHNLNACFCIQCTGGFIRQNNIGVVYNGSGNGDSLHLSAGHFVGLFIKLIAKSHFFQRFLCPRAACLF